MNTEQLSPTGFSQKPHPANVSAVMGKEKAQYRRSETVREITKWVVEWRLNL